MAKMCRRLSAVERVRIELGLRDGLSLTRIAEAIGHEGNGVQGDRPPRRRWGLCRRRAHIQSVGVPRGGRPNRLKPGNSRPWRLCCASGRNKSQAGESAWKTTSRHPPGWRCEAIYQTIHALPRGELKKELLACLRQGKPHRGRRSKADEKRGKIRDMTSIHERPAEIQGRLVPGHWEGDLIKGAGNRSSIGTLVERTSGKLVLVKLTDAKAATTRNGFRRGPAARPGSLATNDDLRPGQGDGPPQGTRPHRHPGLLRRPARALAAGLQREHQRIAAAVPPEGG